MFNNMLRTLGIRVAAALISLFIIVVAGRELGAEVLGQISLLVVAITIINLVGGFAGGSALVYLIPRNEGRSLLYLSQLWAIVSGLATGVLLYYLGAFPVEYSWHVFVLGILGSINQNYMSALLAQQRIRAHNFITLLQSVGMIVVLILMISVFDTRSIESYIMALYVSYVSVLIVCVLLVRNTGRKNGEKTGESLSILFSYGSLVQLSSILALLTYRLTYYYTEAWLGLAALGILSVAVQISEAVWILPKSIALVQYSKISNLKDDTESAQLTVFLMFVTTILTAVGLLVLVFLPDSVYIGIFGSDFVGLSSVIRFIIPGIFSISLNIILSHFFSGTGRILFNLIGSAIGLFVVATAGYILINGGKLADAALVSSIGYFSNFVFAAISFFVINGGIKLSVKKGKAIFIRK